MTLPIGQRTSSKIILVIFPCVKFHPYKIIDKHYHQFLPSINYLWNVAILPTFVNQKQFFDSTEVSTFKT